MASECDVTNSALSMESTLPAADMPRDDFARRGFHEQHSEYFAGRVSAEVELRRRVSVVLRPMS